jgi:hypothetical protein
MPQTGMKVLLHADPVHLVLVTSKYVTEES